MKIKDIFENLRVLPGRTTSIHQIIVYDYDNDENMNEVAEVLKRWPRNIMEVKVLGKQVVVKVTEDGKHIGSRQEAVNLVKMLLKDHNLTVD